MQTRHYILKQTAPVVLLFTAALLIRLYAVCFLPSYTGPDGNEYDYIAQELVRWMSSGTVADVARLKETAEIRGWLYPLFIGIIYRIGGADPLFVKVVQAFLDSITCVLMYAAARHLFGKAAGFAAMLAAACYPGFIFFCTFLAQETTTAFLLTLMFLLIVKSRAGQSKMLFFSAGILLGIITLYRPAFQFLFLPVGAVLYGITRARPSLFRACAAGLVLVIAGWALCARLTGNPVILYTSNVWSFYDTMRHDGWHCDDFFPPLTMDLQEVLDEEGLDTTTTGPYNLLPSRVYCKAALRKITQDLTGYASLLLKKWGRIWWYADTYPGRWHSGRVLLQLLFHRAIVVCAAMGTITCLASAPCAWIAAAVILYGSAVGALFVGIPRYNIPLMPFAIIFAAGFFTTRCRALRELSAPAAKSRTTGAACLAAVGVLLYYISQMSLLSALFPDTAPCSLYHIMVVVRCLLIGCAGWVVFFVAPHGTAVAAFVPTALIAALYANAALTSRTWHEWQAPLASSPAQIKQEIFLETPLDPARYEAAQLLIDMFEQPGSKNSGWALVVSLNGRNIRTYSGGLHVPEGKFSNRFFGFYKTFFFDAYGMTPNDLRQWHEITVPVRLLQGTDRVEVRMEMHSGDADAQKQGLIVFGDYASCRASTLFEGPSFETSGQDTSLYKIMPYSGDSRLDRRTVLHSSKTISTRFDGRRWICDDLSSGGGMQSGTYRIRIRLTDRKGHHIIY